jgi:serine/threonine-protein kinase
LALTPGTRLGVYEVTAQIGVGGMGEVYRATDTKLKRQVAIKIVPASLAADADRLARFQREAEVLASLNHPHIAAIYGLEEADSVKALVMELVEGEDLAQRLARGPIPLDEALPMAKQIAEALEAAHEQGIIHRDLKPANIKVRDDGTVKVLDFGLAKLTEVRGASRAGEAHLTQSPTITTPAMTQTGLILGTAAYMSPEQAKGRTVDRRADVWAFGAVLFEMLTGARSFDGDDMTDVLGAVVRLDPAWSRLPAGTPPAVRALLEGCLAKDRRQRIGDIAAALFVLKAPTLGTSSWTATGARVVARPPLWRRLATHTGTLVVGGVLTGALVWLATRPTTSSPRVSRLQIMPPSAAALVINGLDRDLTITPDGSRIVYIGGTGGTTLFVRALDQLDATPLARVGGSRSPFVSPDGQWVGFIDGNTVLKKVSMIGGPAVTVGQLDGVSRGATWSPDGTIIIATGNATTGLLRIGAAGGEATVLTRPDRARGEADHLWPQMLPGGQAVLFTITATTGGLDAASVAVLDLRTGTQTTLIRGGTDAHYVASGHLVYGTGGTLRAVAFDLAKLAVVGPPVSVLPQVLTGLFGSVDVVVASDGTLVYVPGGSMSSTQRTLVWVDRQGQGDADCGGGARVRLPAGLA